MAANTALPILRVSQACTNLKGLDMYTDTTQEEHLQIDFKNKDADDFQFHNFSQILHFFTNVFSSGKYFPSAKLKVFIPAGKIIKKMKGPR